MPKKTDIIKGDTQRSEIGIYTRARHNDGKKEIRSSQEREVYTSGILHTDSKSGSLHAQRRKGTQVYTDDR